MYLYTGTQQVGCDLDLLLGDREGEQLVDAVVEDVVLDVSDLPNEGVHDLVLQNSLVGVDGELGPEQASTGASLLVTDGPGGADQVLEDGGEVGLVHDGLVGQLSVAGLGRKGVIVDDWCSSEFFGILLI